MILNQREEFLERARSRSRAPHLGQTPPCPIKPPPFTLPRGRSQSFPPFKGECPLQFLPVPVELLPFPHPILPVSLPLSGSKCCQGNRITNDFPLCLGPWEETHKPSRCPLTPDAPPHRAVQPFKGPSPHPAHFSRLYHGGISGSQTPGSKV